MINKTYHFLGDKYLIISYDDFEKVDLRSGTIIKTEIFPRAKKPAYKIASTQQIPKPGRRGERFCGQRDQQQ